MTEDKSDRILVVRTDRIGDVILTTPALKALREKCPNAYISLLVAKQTEVLVRNIPYVNEVLVFDKDNEHKGFFGFIKLVKQIRYKKFDCAVIYHTKQKTNLLCALAGIPRRVGYKNNKFGFLLTEPYADDRPKGEKHESEYCLGLLESFGINESAVQPYISSIEANEQWFIEQCTLNHVPTNKSCVAIHLGASDKNKCWPVDRFVELVEQLAQKYPVHFVLIGSADIAHLAKEFENRCQLDVWNMVGKTDLSQLVTLLSKCQMLISNDSGPVHIASSLQVPVVSIFTRNQPGINPERWHPLGEKSAYVAVKAHLPLVDPSKMAEEIPVQRVFEAVDALFKLC